MQFGCEINVNFVLIFP